MESLDGKVALVTGSSTGIGEAIARAFGAEGAAVTVNSASSVEAGEKVAAELARGAYVRADVAVPSDARRLVDETVRAFGRLDILVNNAGITAEVPLTDLDGATPELWQRIFAVNVFGTWQVTVEAMPHLKASGSGSVVNISSLAGVRQLGSCFPYSVSKAALNHMTRLLAVTVGPEVRVNAVAPGLVVTARTEGWDGFRRLVEDLTPLGRTGTPEDVAGVVLGLVRSTWMTGEVITLDGGQNLRSPGPHWD